jgi:YggT family protein
VSIILIIRLINLLFQAFSFLILVEVIASWILVANVRLPLWAYDLLQGIHTITSPVLTPIRRLLPSLGGLDLSPLVALLLLEVLRNVIVNALLGAV